MNNIILTTWTVHAHVEVHFNVNVFYINTKYKSLFYINNLKDLKTCLFKDQIEIKYQISLMENKFSNPINLNGIEIKLKELRF